MDLLAIILVLGALGEEAFNSVGNDFGFWCIGGLRCSMAFAFILVLFSTFLLL